MELSGATAIAALIFLSYQPGHIISGNTFYEAGVVEPIDLGHGNLAVPAEWWETGLAEKWRHDHTPSTQ